MSSMLKSTVLGLALLGGVAATAHAQSVSTLPPTSPATAPSATTAPVYSSSARMNPDPGSGVNIRAEHSQPVASAKISPDPGSGVNIQSEHYSATASDQDPARQPYSTYHFGPAPN